MTDDLLARAKTALEGVTPGPWHWSANGQCLDAGRYDEVIQPAPVDCMSRCYGGTSRIEIEPADAEFIAAARTLVPELVAEVERLQAVVQRATELEETWGAEEYTKDSYDRWIALCVALRGES